MNENKTKQILIKIFFLQFVMRYSKIRGGTTFKDQYPC